MTPQELNALVLNSYVGPNQAPLTLSMFANGSWTSDDIVQILEKLQTTVYQNSLQNPPSYQTNGILDLSGEDMGPITLEIRTLINWLAIRSWSVIEPTSRVYATAIPSIAGNTTKEDLILTPAVWHKNTSSVSTYQWFANDLQIPGATQLTLPAGSAPAGARVFVEETITYLGRHPIGRMLFWPSGMDFGTSVSGVIGSFSLVLNVNTGIWGPTGTNPVTNDSRNKMWYSNGYFYLDIWFTTPGVLGQFRTPGILNNISNEEWSGTTLTGSDWEVLSGVLSGHIEHYGGFIEFINLKQSIRSEIVSIVAPTESQYFHETNQAWLDSFGNPVKYIQ